MLEVFVDRIRRHLRELESPLKICSVNVHEPRGGTGWFKVFIEGDAKREVLFSLSYERQQTITIFGSLHLFTVANQEVLAEEIASIFFQKANSESVMA